MKIIKYTLREFKNLFEYYLIPLLVVLLPHKIYYPIFRFICYRTFFYSIYEQGSYPLAQKYLTDININPPELWKRNVKLLYLMDIADAWLFWLRPKKAKKLIETTGHWIKGKGFIALGTHWGTGIPSLVSIKQSGMDPFFVYSRKPVKFSERGLIEYSYRKFRWYYIDKISGSTAITTGSAYQRIKAQVINKGVPVILFDAPKEKSKAKYMLKILGNEYSIASGFVNLICYEKLPSQMYSVNLDFNTGIRSIQISSEIQEQVNENQLLDKMSNYLNHIILSSPENWFFWCQSSYLLSKKQKLKIPVLLYHSGNITGNTYQDNDTIAFKADLKTIEQQNITIISAKTLVDYLYGSIDLDSEKKYLVITLDDGVNLDFVDSKYPKSDTQESFYTSIKNANTFVHITSFVIASPKARETMQKTCLENHPLLSHDWWQSAAKSSHFSIENHSWDHVHPTLESVKQKDGIKGDFSSVNCFEDADNQIRKSSEYIESIIGCKTTLFAYPFGHYNEYLTEEYFPKKQKQIRAAFTCEPQYVNKDTNVWKIPRFICGANWSNTEELLKILTNEYTYDK